MLEALVALLVDRDPPIEMFLAPVSDPLMEQVRVKVLKSRECLVLILLFFAFFAFCCGVFLRCFRRLLFKAWMVM